MSTTFIPYYVTIRKNGGKGIYEDPDGKWVVCEGDDIKYCYRVESKEIALQKLEKMKSEESIWCAFLLSIVVVVVGLAVFFSSRLR